MNFRNRFGDSVFFDQDGDPPASYDIINWQLDNGKVQHVTVGQFISTQSGTYKLQIDEKKIVWMTGQMVKILKHFSPLSIVMILDIKHRNTN